MAGNALTSGYEKLQYSQVVKLNTAYQKVFEVHGRGNFPTLEVSMQKIVKDVYSKLLSKHVPVEDVRLNGSLASYVVGDSSVNQLSYNDIDLIFSVHFDSEETLLGMKELVIECLLEYLPGSASKQKLGTAALTDAYVSKLTKVWQTNGDKWSLISLSNNAGMNFELKFVDSMKRKFQFSVDSFQIILDSLMQFYDVSNEQISHDFYPSVIAESVYGDFSEALYHLNNKLIATHSPQDIRGGGLLKYCDLLSRGYRPACNLSEVEKLERLMCSRFFIDYSDVTIQFQKIDSYLVNHFVGNYGAMIPYLYELYRVVNGSTVCLMGHERRQALDLIQQMACNIQFEVDRQQMEQEFSKCSCYDSTPTTDTFYYSSSLYNTSYSPMPIYGYSSIQNVY